MAQGSDYGHELDRLIDLWDKHSDRPWSVSGDRNDINVALINAYVSHSVNLSRGVRLLDRAGLKFESISLVRSTMEAVATAAWLALYPEKTPDFALVSASERKKTLDEIARSGLSDANPGRAQSDQFLAGVDKNSLDPEGRWLRNRFESLKGGEELYVIYRVLCGWDHATNSLADQYIGAVVESEMNPSGLLLLDRAQDPQSWLGIQSALLLRAQIAADMVQTVPRHQTQLRNFARRFGLNDTIEPTNRAV
jgi:hypothetical protein